MSRHASHDVQISVSLSKLIPSKRNPRRVKPEREAHRRLVASIRAHGLLEPLVVRPDPKDSGSFRIIAGNRRLAALREVFKDAAKEPKVLCVLRAVDDDTADAMALAENFAREPMHPLDEADAFAHLAREEAKGVEAIAAEFGVTLTYVRQRMKLATLADPIKAAYRDGGLDTGTAEAFASVPPDRQAEVWQEVGGNPQHAQHVRNVIAHAWIEAASAIFDVSKLPEGAVSRDLFNDKVLVERKAFMEAQAEALLAERSNLSEDGWAEVVIGPQADIQDRLWSMAEAEQEYETDTAKKLARLDQRRQKLESSLEELPEGDEAVFDAVQKKLDALEEAEQTLTKDAPTHHAEATKAIGTAFLILDPDGRVRREYRVPRNRSNPSGGNGPAADLPPEPPKPPTSDDLSEPQLGCTFTHQALAVREALLGDKQARRRVLVLILHEKIRAEALAIRHDANGTTLHADHTEGFTSPALTALQNIRAEIDPFKEAFSITDDDAFVKLADVPDKQIDALIDLLTVECLHAHLIRRTELIHRLAGELAVDVRRVWRPDATWLAGYRKAQLAHLIGELQGPVYAGAAEKKKKSELVEQVATLFTAAAEGKLDDPKLAERLNRWLPANLREEPKEAEGQPPNEKAA